ncbi:MAG: hypothetical protein ACT4TC_23490 [Myxococcaceae bacterium]
MFGFVIGALCLVGLFKVARGGGHWRSPRYGRRRERWMLRWLYERLDTTPGQEKVIQEAVDELRQAGRKAATDLRNTGPDIAKALRGEQLDHEVLKQGFLRQDAQLEEVRRAVLVGLEKVHGALDARQREELAELFESIPAWMEGRMGGRGLGFERGCGGPRRGRGFRHAHHLRGCDHGPDDDAQMA